MQYNLYTVSVTTGSNIVNGALGTKFLSKVKAGNSFKVKGDAVVYQISSVVSDTQLTLSTNYQGATAANLQYQVTTDYTPNFGFAEINIGDQDWPTHLTVETLRKIDSVLAYIAGDGLKFQGDWNATTNVPTIPAASSSNLGHLYKVTVSGSTSVSGITHWVVGDTVISNGTAWFRIALPEYSAEEYAVAAEASASSASTSASTATTKANDASGYAQSATVSMNNAASSASTASTKAGEASTSATNAAASAGTATTKAGEASTSAINANTAKLAAEAARDQALTAFDNFDDKYLGQKSANPTLDNDGNPLVSGALYFNTNDIGAGGGMKVYDGATWVAAYAAIDSTLVALSTVSTSADKLIYATGVDTFNTTTLTSAARSLLDDTTTTSMLTTLGAAPAAQGVTNGDSHNHVGGDGAAISLTAAVSGTLPVANGGTGATTFTANYLLKGNGTNAVTASGVYEDANGNLGIGAIPDVGYPARLWLFNTSDCKLRIIKWGVVATTVSAVDTAMAFGCDLAAGDTERMRLTSTGNVLIGTTTDDGVNKLQVNGNIKANGFLINYGSGGVTTNSSVGLYALNSNITGSYNTATGVYALNSNTTGSYNTATGVYALNSNTTGSANTATGVSALNSNTTGSYNTATGLSALHSNTTGSYNTATGVSALNYNTTGSANTALGTQYNLTGNYSPAFNCTTENNRVSIAHTGVTNAYINVAWTIVSDERDKTDFTTVPLGLEFISKLKPVSYRRKVSRDDPTPDGPVRYGFKAQDILVLEGDSPVIVDNEDIEHLRLVDSNLLAVLVKAVQELKAEVEQLKGE